MSDCNNCFDPCGLKVSGTFSQSVGIVRPGSPGPEQRQKLALFYNVTVSNCTGEALRDARVMMRISDLTLFNTGGKNVRSIFEGVETVKVIFPGDLPGDATNETILEINPTYGDGALARTFFVIKLLYPGETTFQVCVLLDVEDWQGDMVGRQKILLPALFTVDGLSVCHGIARGSSVIGCIPDILNFDGSATLPPPP